MRIGVVGTGYVGLVAACCLAKSGHSVIAVEKDINKLELLKKGKVPFFEEGLEEILQNNLTNDRISFTSDLTSALEDISTVIIAVGTPSLPDGRVDLSQVNDVAQEIARNAKNELIVVMKSTVPPGTGNSLCKRFFDKSGVKIHYISNPEFLREGTSVWDWYNADRIIIGCDDEEVGRKFAEIYSDIRSPIVFMDVVSAEMVKYASNAFLATKISFINEIANLCELVGANIDKVAPAIGMDSRIGPHFLKSGLGYGGSCFPKDTKGLDYISSFNGYRVGVLKAVIEVNARQKMIAIRKIQKVLGDLNRKHIAVLGLAFKPGTDDVREAPAIDIINYLVAEGAFVSASDPLAIGNARHKLPSCVKLYFNPYEALKGAQAVLLATEWPGFINLDWSKVKSLMQDPYLVVDGRNALDIEELVSLGYTYSGIGRCVAE